jgi:hypothetical protein
MPPPAAAIHSLHLPFWPQFGDMAIAVVRPPATYLFGT